MTLPACLGKSHPFVFPSRWMAEVGGNTFSVLHQEIRLSVQTSVASHEASPGSPTPPGWVRLDGVDILRGLAILTVLLNHVNMRLFLAHIPYTQGLPRQLVGALFWNGQNGVQIFFAVSGFLITSTSIRRWGALGQVSIRDFYVLRFARIAPLLLTLLAVLSLLHLFAVTNFVVPDRTGGLGRALLAALTFHINVLEAQRGYLPGNWDILWSLSVEETFYLLFPLVCRALGRSRWLIPLLLVFVGLGPFGRTVLTGGNEVWQEYSYLGGMDAIALGCLTAIALARFPPSTPVSRALGALGGALLVFTLCLPATVTAWGLGKMGLGMTLVAVGTCLVIAAVAPSQWAAPRILAPLTALGRRSYEVYLTHMFVVFVLYGSFKSAGSSLGAVPVLFISTLIIAGLLGEAVARFYSEPLNWLIRRRLGQGTGRFGTVVRARASA